LHVSVLQSKSLYRSRVERPFYGTEMVFCCIVAWIQPDIFGCQQDFLVVWRWNELRTFQGIFENNFIDFREAVSLEKIFEIVQENTLKCSKLISFLGNKKSSWNHCQAWSCYYATGCFVAFLGDFFEQLLVLALCWFGSTFSLGHLRV